MTYIKVNQSNHSNYLGIDAQCVAIKAFIDDGFVNVSSDAFLTIICDVFFVTERDVIVGTVDTLAYTTNKLGPNRMKTKS